MTTATSRQSCSSKRGILASYAHPYAVAVQKRRETGRPQYVLRTDDPTQPFRVSHMGPKRWQTLMTLIA